MSTFDRVLITILILWMLVLVGIAGRSPALGPLSSCVRRSFPFTVFSLGS